MYEKTGEYNEDGFYSPISLLPSVFSAGDMVERTSVFYA